jgi:hypothetical protein
VPVRGERENPEEKELTQRAQRRRRGHGDTEDMVGNGDNVEDEILRFAQDDTSISMA